MTDSKEPDQPQNSEERSAVKPSNAAKNDGNNQEQNPEGSPAASQEPSQKIEEEKTEEASAGPSPESESKAEEVKPEDPAAEQLPGGDEKAGEPKEEEENAEVPGTEKIPEPASSIETESKAADLKSREPAAQVQPEQTVEDKAEETQTEDSKPADAASPESAEPQEICNGAAVEGISGDIVIKDQAQDSVSEVVTEGDTQETANVSQESEKLADDGKPRLEDLKFVPQSKAECRKVFLVPGSNNIMYQEVMKLLKKLGLEAIVSKSRINYTESMEQKFIDYPEVGFAVVLLCGDDFVYPKESKPANAKIRASQDNVFEMAYFLARLGRTAVFILYQEQKNFLLPTDLMSAIYTPYVKGGHWRHEMFDRLRLCEYKVDDQIEI